jgi:hypothetical protein
MELCSLINIEKVYYQPREYEAAGEQQFSSQAPLRSRIIWSTIAEQVHPWYVSMLYAMNGTNLYWRCLMKDRAYRYAVAVSDEELYLFLHVTRNPKGEIFAMIPMESPEERKLWDPHASYHKDGRHHHKSYDQPFWIRHGPKPDSTFQGIKWLLSRPIAAHEPRTFKVRCEPKKYDKVFKMSIDKVRPECYRTAIDIDIAGPHEEEPILPTNLRDANRIIHQEIYKDAIPWIVATFYTMEILGIE